MTHYIDAKIAKNLETKQKQIQCIVKALHDFHSKRDDFCLGLSFPDGVDFSDQEAVTRIGLVGPLPALLDILETELKDFADDFLIQFSHPKVMPEGSRKIVLKHKGGIGLRGNIEAIRARAISQQKHLQVKHGKEVSLAEIQTKMLMRAQELEKEIYHFPVPVYSVSEGRFFTMKLVQKSAETAICNRKEKRQYNIYGIRGPVAVLPQ